MTNERLIRFGLLDLSAVHLTCESCKADLSLPLDAFGTNTRVLPNLPERCPQCGTGWELDSEANRLRKFLFGLAGLRQHIDAGDAPVSLHFDLPEKQRQ